jgi:hypothetical protein
MRSDVIEIDEIVLVDEVLANSVLRDVEDDLPSKALPSILQILLKDIHLNSISIS